MSRLTLAYSTSSIYVCGQFCVFSSVTLFGSEKHRCILCTFELKFHSCLKVCIIVVVTTTIVDVQIWQNLDTILKLARISICVSA